MAAVVVAHAKIAGSSELCSLVQAIGPAAAPILAQLATITIPITIGGFFFLVGSDGSAVVRALSKIGRMRELAVFGLVEAGAGAIALALAVIAETGSQLANLVIIPVGVYFVGAIILLLARLVRLTFYAEIMLAAD